MQSSHQRHAWRVLAIIICGAIGWGACLSAIVNITSDSNPVFALRLMPDNPIALAAKIDANLSASNIDQRALLSNFNDAVMSMRGQAINARGIRQLALIADANGKTDDARALMRLSTKLSRRDFVAQLWLIEDGVQADDIVSTMAHYDIALRTSPESAGILHPILNSALTDETIQRVFAPYLRTNPPWLESFLSFAINSGSSPIAVAETIMKGGRLPDTASYQVLSTQLLQQLAAKGTFVEMFRYYRQLKGANQSVITSTGFNASETAQEYVPITWQTLTSPGIDAIFEASDSLGTRQLRVIAGSGERAPALRKLLGLSPGIYRFSQNITPVRLTNGASAYWQLLCLKDTSLLTIWRSDIDIAEILIPAACKGQYLEYVIAGGSNQEGAEIVIKSVSFSKIKPI